jgi:predicted P-loop ATPase
VFTDLDSEVPQIWAEALVMHQNGEALYMTEDLVAISEATQEAHRERSPKEGIIREFLERDVPEDWSKRTLDERRMFWQKTFETGAARQPMRRREKVCALEIWCEALNGDPKYMKRSDAIEINSIVERTPGWMKSKNGIRTGKDYGLQKGFVRVEF